MVRTISMSKSFNFRDILRLAAMVFYCSSVAYVANAATFADDACDPEYYESLESRAWLEAQREITQNQNLIFKADSVLEYTCFDAYLGQLVASAPNMFSGSNRWGPPPGDMGDSLYGVAGGPLVAYDTANFDHNLLGGRSGTPYEFDAGNGGTIAGNTVNASSYSCNVMNAVWELAKCMDFIDQASYSPGGAAADRDGFFTFAEYATSDDKRFLPTACTNATTRYDTELQLAVGTTTPWDEDLVRTYYELIYPTSGNVCGPSGASTSTSVTNVSKVQTGLIVEKNTGVTRFNEYICVVPGCRYVPSGFDSGVCSQNP